MAYNRKDYAAGEKIYKVAGRFIEVSIIGDNTQNQSHRHSGKGLDPACHTAPRSGQGRYPTPWVFSIAWIPAFAGMTAAENSGVMNYGKINNDYNALDTELTELL